MSQTSKLFHGLVVLLTSCKTNNRQHKSHRRHKDSGIHRVDVVLGNTSARIHRACEEASNDKEDNAYAPKTDAALGQAKKDIILRAGCAGVGLGCDVVRLGCVVVRLGCTGALLETCCTCVGLSFALGFCAKWSSPFRTKSCAVFPWFQAVRNAFWSISSNVTSGRMTGRSRSTSSSHSEYFALCLTFPMPEVEAAGGSDLACIGLPHFGQARARSLTGRPQSGQSINATEKSYTLFDRKSC